VLYIAAAGRSGTTMLNALLGSVASFFAVGELRFIWQRGIVEDRLCGCGVPFSRCEVWHAVLDEAYGGASNVDVEHMIREQARTLRTRNLPRLLASQPIGSLAPKQDAAYLQALDQLYTAIHTVTGCQVIVDSSKPLSYGESLRQLPTLDVSIVHLIRDPRANAFSWTQVKNQPDRGTDGVMERHSALKASLLWDVWNFAAGALWPASADDDTRLRLRFEDLIADPPRAIRQVLSTVGHVGLGVPFLDDRTVILAKNHTVAGNPDRLTNGQLQIHPDGAWRTQMPRRRRFVVNLTTAPMQWRFGYQVRSADWP
jgi:hypothetical protein